MAERHRIHPAVDVEAPLPSSSHAPSKPLQTQPPPPPKKKRRSCCCRCLCWTVLTVVILVVIIGAIVGILFLAFDPKLPKYSVDRLAISNFTVDDNMTVSATFNLTVTTKNPNKKIGIYYRGGSHLSAWYTNTSLCTGTFPVFYQGHKNTTVLSLLLSGETQLGSGLLQELQQQQQTGTIPLVFRGNVPVTVKLGSLKLPKVTFKVKCDIIVNTLSSSNTISLKSSSCKFRLKL
ncbi:harpin-induced protein 1 domain containing protein [Musa troglodytarum]|uniref:Harpin-induced protein 1 domain containing protein n=1 Tax=Musa troglodytarum TaxID=320322 RepID=A0A9E7FE57_9LILI|nr:harpin-induced protein 1 domain containing protein [Musa troglodytarum]